jgi:hypothetical protein
MTHPVPTAPFYPSTMTIYDIFPSLDQKPGGGNGFTTSCATLSACVPTLPAAHRRDRGLPNGARCGHRPDREREL